VAEMSSKPAASTGLVLQQLKVKGNKPEEVAYGGEQEEVASWSGRDRIVVPVTPLPPCESGFFHCFQLSLDPDSIPFEGKIGGEFPGTAIQWRMQFMANTEEPKITFMEDECRDRWYQKTIQTFNEQGAGGVKDRPNRVANALAAFQAPPPAPSPPEVPEGGEEGAPAADASGEPPPPAKPTKTARDGTVVELDPERFTRIVPKVDAPATFDADSWQERIASVKELLSTYKAETLPTFAKGRTQAKEQRHAAGQDKASAFKQLRSSFLKNLQQLEEQRAELARAYAPPPPEPPTPMASGKK